MNNEKKQISVVLAPKKAEEFFYNALCNGLPYFCQYGFLIDWDEKDYKKAKASWNKKHPNSQACREDIWMEILRVGGKLIFEDQEGGDNTKSIVLSDVHTKVALTPIQHLSDMINETDDATTGDMIIQSVLFDGEIIFG